MTTEVPQVPRSALGPLSRASTWDCAGRPRHSLGGRDAYCTIFGPPLDPRGKLPELYVQTRSHLSSRARPFPQCALIMDTCTALILAPAVPKASGSADGVRHCGQTETQLWSARLGGEQKRSCAFVLQSSAKARDQVTKDECHVH